MPPMAFTGLVTKVGFMNKTATVTVSRFVTHPKVGKRIEKTKKILTHDENNQLRHGDTVLIRNCPPVSARKRFTLDHVLRSPEREREAALKKKAAEAAAPLAADTQASPEAAL
ncbi:nucleic acid-binding protein [Daedalea quercina L-15889]|uniref:Nucleic acid-binding protein n=1 Tax=Daedalea quercina L-15889 TaxID=1314783 RepID=A0A165PQR8_9APHY|nr:nucleic acid-binding protein [Daedalea quercina L-15889]